MQAYSMGRREVRAELEENQLRIMTETACITIDGKTHNYPVIMGTEGEKCIDIRRLRSDSGYITYDDGYANTGSCMSEITFIDGEKGILRYRGTRRTFRFYRSRLPPYLWGTAERGTTRFIPQSHSRQCGHSPKYVPQFRGLSTLLPPDGDTLCHAQFTRVLLPPYGHQQS